MSELNVGNLNVDSYLSLPLYDDSQLPASPPIGHMVFSTTREKIVVWDGSAWISIGSKKYSMVPGGSNYTETSLSGDYAGYKVIKYTGNGTLNITNAPSDDGIEILMISGGGGGGGVIGGGGGAGGVIYKRKIYIPEGTYNITIGQGGQGGNGWNTATQEGHAGSPTTFSGGNIFYEAIGGGGGCAHGGSTPGAIAGKGGSGGGSANIRRHGGQATGVMGGNLDLHLRTEHTMNQPGTFNSDAQENSTVVGRCSQVGYVPGYWSDTAHFQTDPATLKGWQGHPGGDWGDGNMGAGGGGAGQCGQNAGVPNNRGGDGGHGIYCEIEGVKKAYAGGGGGGVRGSGRIRGIGGVGGGGNGGRNSLGPTSYSSPTANAASNGQDNTGGGGGGGGYNGTSGAIIGGNGGPGILIIRYKES